MPQTILILDFGGQYCQLIARRIREANVYCHILPYHANMDRINELNPSGIVLSGGPSSVLADDSPRCDMGIFKLGVPVLGICYGMQLMAYELGGKVVEMPCREYGRVTLNAHSSALLKGVDTSTQCWMSHTYSVTHPPEGFNTTSVTDACPTSSMENSQKQLYGVQFHPEVTHTPQGDTIIRNFLFDICRCAGDWTMSNYIESSVADIRSKVGDGQVLLGLSGGVDSSVAAALLYKAIGSRLTCVFVDHGMLRKDEAEQVKRVFSQDFPVNLIAVDAKDRFLGKLDGISEPERKRKIIGEEFIRVFEDQIKHIGEVDFLAQGTIYPDVIESGQGSSADVIKSHHNVGGLPKWMKFKGVIEPLRMLFKDEVRRLGVELGLPSSLVNRQPFPGPGLAIRIIGEITEEKLTIVKDSDAILRQEISNAGLDGAVSQFFTVLTGIRSVGVMGDGRTYDYTVAIRAVTTDDFMTADWAKLPYEILAKISSRIVNEVRHVNRVVYDITTKPPASIEWE